MTVYSEDNYLNDLLKFELDNYHSREAVTVLSGESVVMGEVIGKVTKDIPETGTADGDNTGTGDMTGVDGGDAVKLGTYTVTCVDDSEAGSEEWEVKDPDGATLPEAKTGDEFDNEQISFTINQDGEGTDFAKDDKFTITVEEGSGKAVPIDFTAVDGSQEAYGIMIEACDASEEDADGLAIVRDAQIVADYLTWPDGASDDQKAAALAQLKEKGIVTRDEA